MIINMKYEYKKARDQNMKFQNKWLNGAKCFTCVCASLMRRDLGKNKYIWNWMWGMWILNDNIEEFGRGDRFSYPYSKMSQNDLVL